LANFLKWCSISLEFSLEYSLQLDYLNLYDLIQYTESTHRDHPSFRIIPSRTICMIHQTLSALCMFNLVQLLPPKNIRIGVRTCRLGNLQDSCIPRKLRPMRFPWHKLVGRLLRHTQTHTIFLQKKTGFCIHFAPYISSDLRRTATCMVFAVSLD